MNFSNRDWPVASAVAVLLLRSVDRAHLVVKTTKVIGAQIMKNWLDELSVLTLGLLFCICQ